MAWIASVSQEGKLGNCLWFLYNQMSAFLAQKLEAVGESVAEWMVLWEFYDAREASPSNLARRSPRPGGDAT